MLKLQNVYLYFIIILNLVSFSKANRFYELQPKIEYWAHHDEIKRELLYLERRYNIKLWAAKHNYTFVVSAKESIEIYDSDILSITQFGSELTLEDNPTNLRKNLQKEDLTIHVVTSNDDIDLHTLFKGKKYEQNRITRHNFHNGRNNALSITFKDKNEFSRTLDFLKKDKSIFHIFTNNLKIKHNSFAFGSGIGNYKKTISQDYNQFEYGADQIITVMDTGIDTSHCLFNHIDSKTDLDINYPKKMVNEKNIKEQLNQIKNEMSKHKKIEAYLSLEYKEGSKYFTTDFIDEEGGHGTHVSASAAGYNYGSDCKNSKYAYSKAKILFVDVQDNSESKTTENEFLNIPHSITWLLKASYDLGSRINSNSWGGQENGYSFPSYEIDHFTHLHPDYTIIFSAGNSGPNKTTILSPGNAKNAITVGSTLNVYESFTNYSTKSYFYNESTKIEISYPAYFNENHLSSFSSRGPTEDGRIKPDVVFPGEFILSAKARIPGKQNKDNQKYDYVLMRGTSMAAPQITTLVTLIEDKLRRTYHVKNSLSSLKKAILIECSKPLKGSSQSIIYDKNRNIYTMSNINKNSLTLYDEGFGRVNLQDFLSNKIGFVNELEIFAFEEPLILHFECVMQNQDASITMVYDDVPSMFSTNVSQRLLINDLNIRIIIYKKKYIISNTPIKIINGNNILYKTDNINNVEKAKFSISEGNFIRMIITSSGPILSLRNNKVQSQLASLAWSHGLNKIDDIVFPKCTIFDLPYECITEQGNIGVHECLKNGEYEKTCSEVLPAKTINLCDTNKISFGLNNTCLPLHSLNQKNETTKTKNYRILTKIDQKRNNKLSGNYIFYSLIILPLSILALFIYVVGFYKHKFNI